MSCSWLFEIRVYSNVTAGFCQIPRLQAGEYEKAPVLRRRLFEIYVICALAYVVAAPVPAVRTVLTIANESRITTIPITAYMMIFLADSIFSWLPAADT